MTHWTRALCCALTLGLYACAGDSTSTSDGGTGDAGACFQQPECPCTCLCPDGIERPTYSECVGGHCTACAYYCNALCG
jgi:hypothetical protein